jgi:signal transduction histidine kinase
MPGSVGPLAGGIAHDFNNLLMVILGYCELALNELDESASLRQDIEQIEQAGRRASKLTQQLLAFSRKRVLQPRSLNLNEVVHDVVGGCCSG